MPEWLTHVIFACLVFKLCSLRYRSLDGADMALVLMGSILPDFSKIDLAFGVAGMDIQNMVNPLHTPIGSILVAGLLSLLFQNCLKAFMLLVIGACTHLLLDTMESQIAGGIMLLFPLSWNKYSLAILPNDDLRVGGILLAAMLAVVTVLRILKKVCRKT